MNLCDFIKMIDGVPYHCQHKASIGIDSYDGDEDDMMTEYFCDEHDPRPKPISDERVGAYTAQCRAELRRKQEQKTKDFLAGKS